MKRNQKNYFGLFIFSFVISICVNNAAIAFSRDCSIYESIYNGITCRNASLEDTPICNDDEDILNSPRAPKLCCCERLFEPQGKTNDGTSGEEINKKFNSCKDFNCQPGSDGERSIPCQKGFIGENASRYEDDTGIPCCCPMNKTTYTDFFCRVIGCADILASASFSSVTPPPFSGQPSSTLKCADNLTYTRIDVTTPPGTISFNSGPVSTSPTDVSAPPPPPPSDNNIPRYSCCCPDELKLENITCKLAINCKEKSQLGQCTTGQQLVDNIIVHKQGESVGKALSCCCKQP